MVRHHLGGKGMSLINLSDVIFANLVPFKWGSRNWNKGIDREGFRVLWHAWTEFE